MSLAAGVVWELFQPASGDVGVKYSTTNDQYQFLLPVDATRYWRKDLRRISSVGDGTVHQLAASGIVTVSGSTLTQEVALQPGFSAEEYAHRFYQAGDEPGDLMGNVHGNETETSFTVTVDGRSASMSDGDVRWGDTIVATRVTELIDPADEVTKVADVTTTYTLTSDGLKVAWSLTWAVAGTVSLSYPAMLALDDTFDKVSFDTADTDYYATEAGADNMFEDESVLAFGWLSSGNYGCALAIPTPATSVKNFVNSQSVGSFVNHTASITKIYYARVGTVPEAESVDDGDVWESEAVYRAARFDDPDDALGKEVSVAYLRVTGNNGSVATAPDSAHLDLSGDLDVRVRLAADDWVSGSTQAIISKWGFTSSSRAWALQVTGGGSAQLAFSTDGSSTTNRNSTSAVPFSDGATGWLRVTMDADNGSTQHVVNFYTSTDDTNDPTAVSWTQLGSTVTNAGTVTLNNSGESVGIGGLSNGLTSLLAGGDIYRVWVSNVIGGSAVFDADFSDPTTWVFS